MRIGPVSVRGDHRGKSTADVQVAHEQKQTLTRAATGQSYYDRLKERHKSIGTAVLSTTTRAIASRNENRQRPMDHLYTRADEIADTRMKRPHVVILGAGASLAAFPNGDRSGRQLPLMNNFVSVLGLLPLLQAHGLADRAHENFEMLYSDLHQDPDRAASVAAIEAQVHAYFSGMRLPETVTLYDRLVLSLRLKDVIATFNWDPFLFEACRRHHRHTPIPRIIFLDGSVAVGYCATDRRKGPNGSSCPVCGQPFEASRLLFPIGQKDYATDPFIAAEWTGLRGALASAFAITIFGYGAPASDVEAVALMKEAWGATEKRELEQTEIIDIRSEDDLTQTWNPFIHTHHYDVYAAFSDSLISRHPRRTCEALWAQNLEARFVETNPLPHTDDLARLQAWVDPLLAAERSASR